MKYSLSISQSMEALKKADEIRIKHFNRKALIDLAFTMPDKRYCFEIPAGEEELDIQFFENYKDEIDLLFLVEDIQDGLRFAEHGLKWGWTYPVTNAYDFSALAALYPSTAIVTGDIFFCLPKLINYHIPLRVAPNIAYDAYIPRENGITGTFIRPEDTELYEPYIETFYFITPNGPKQEKTLFEVYKERKWQGNLNLLITNLNYDIDNRGISPEFAEKRLTCEHNCCLGYACRRCITEFLLVSKIDYYGKNALKD